LSIRSARPLKSDGLMDVSASIKRSEEHTSELQSRFDLVCRLLLEKKKIHWESWRLGLKAIALYRDGSKLSQPLSAGDQTVRVPMPKDSREMAEALVKVIPELTPEQAHRMAEAAFAAKAAPAPLSSHVRRRLPSKRHGLTQEAKA